jgi:hypothetical protein
MITRLVLSSILSLGPCVRAFAQAGDTDALRGTVQDKSTRPATELCKPPVGQWF